jgi:hypothetical protein
VHRLTRIAAFLSPWIAVGLAAALVAVYLRPSLLPASTGTAVVETAGTPTPAAGPEIGCSSFWELV